MALKRDTIRRVEGHGWYSTYGSDASDVLDYISGDLKTVEEDEPSQYCRDGMKVFKVTIIVEEQ